MKTKTIRVSDEISPTINSREVIIYFRKYLYDSDVNLKLDFAGVEYISRSAAQELIKLEMQERRVSFIHMSKAFQNFLDAVRNTKKTSIVPTSIEKYSINDF